MRGFFFAHIGWLLLKKRPEVIRAGKDLDFSDLYEDPVVMLQRKLDPWFALYMCFVFPAQIAVKFWGESFWTAFFVAGGLRYVYVLHCTFLVNSAAHLYGDHPYDVMSYPSENPYVSFMAIGEGWHNWHHKYPFDYGEKRSVALRTPLLGLKCTRSHIPHVLTVPLLSSQRTKRLLSLASRLNSTLAS